ncbi:MAG: type II toxin-antitoxin system PemK/MazF family toxin [Gallionellaceae bacterium]
MSFKAFDVVAVPFPFTDRDATKRRPALVISNERFNQRHNQLVLAMITTATDNGWPSDVALSNWQKAGLKVACRFRLKLFTLEQNLVVKTIGHLSSKDAKSVQSVLSDYVGVD